MYKGHQCKQKNCQYRIFFRPDKKGSGFCGYILKAEHSRGCEAKDYTHWQDAPREPKKNNIVYGTALSDGIEYAWTGKQHKQGGQI